MPYLKATCNAFSTWTEETRPNFSGPVKIKMSLAEKPG
jgi:hypothetical protein